MQRAMPTSIEWHSILRSYWGAVELLLYPYPFLFLFANPVASDLLGFTTVRVLQLLLMMTTKMMSTSSLNRQLSSTEFGKTRLDLERVLYAVCHWHRPRTHPVPTHWGAAWHAVASKCGRRTQVAFESARRWQFFSTAVNQSRTTTTGCTNHFSQTIPNIS